MAETGVPTSASETAATAEGAGGGARSQDDVALEMMKFIAVTTGYGRGTQSSAGFSGKPGTRSPEEHADALLELFQRCRKVVKEG
jgi:hypothetical protein